MEKYFSLYIYDKYGKERFIIDLEELQFDKSLAGL